MTVVMQAARGASAFTQTDRWNAGVWSEPATWGDPSTCQGNEPTHRTGKEQNKGWEEAIDELLRMRTLQDDWDGEGSPAPTQELVHAAIKLAQDFQKEDWPPPLRTHVSVNGTIYFEWYNAQHYCEIEIESTGMAEMRYLNKTTRETHAIPCPMW